MSQEQEFQEFRIDDTLYRTLHSPKYRQRKSAARVEPDRVRAAVPGVIVSALVSPGQAVRRGQGLVVLEAMKMENSILAPRDGRVKAVHVERGLRVAKGALLVELAD